MNRKKVTIFNCLVQCKTCKIHNWTSFLNKFPVTLWQVNVINIYLPPTQSAFTSAVNWTNSSSAKYLAPLYMSEGQSQKRVRSGHACIKESRISSRNLHFMKPLKSEESVSPLWTFPGTCWFSLEPMQISQVHNTMTTRRTVISLFWEWLLLPPTSRVVESTLALPLWCLSWLNTSLLDFSPLHLYFAPFQTKVFNLLGCFCMENNCILFTVLLTLLYIFSSSTIFLLEQWNENCTCMCGEFLQWQNLFCKSPCLFSPLQTN